MTKKYALLIGLSLVLLAAGNASGAAKGLPDDFKIIAIAGGVAPFESVFKVEINSNGQAVYSALDAENRSTGVFKVLTRFDVPVSRLEYLYTRIQENRFMELENVYTDTKVLDGSFAALTVTANSKTHTVRTQNKAVKAFDTIMIALNLVLPEDSKVLYNEISY